IRDTVTAEMAIRAALTGHTVLSTLHTNDAPSSVIRLIDMGVAPFLVSSSMMAAIAQRLVRRLCTQCKEPYTLPQALCDSLGFPPGTVAYRSVGCEACRNSGFKGRTAIFEIMVVNDEIRNLIVRGAPLSDIRSLAIQEGMRTLRDQGLRKVRSGVSSLEEVLFVTMG
ncbi:MAG TPA: ATPase, T2SS/T4P/T4SS family, partial [Synergistaceae bacterium]|nr:ATPase, T2SS/T4P/T4SS family [Synergistaceae bacterium]